MDMLQTLVNCLTEEEINTLITKVYIASNNSKEIENYKNLIYFLIDEKQKRKENKKNSKNK